MIEPKTPLPWVMVGNGYIEREGRQVLGRLYAAEDAAYAVHAANVLPEVVAALKSVTDAYYEMSASGDCGHWDFARDPITLQARAAIAKAEAT